MTSIFQSKTPIYSNLELLEIELLWDKATEVNKISTDRKYTSSYTTKPNRYADKLLDWGETQLGFQIKRDGCNLILHKFFEGDYFDKHRDNVKRENNFRTYVLGFNLNDDYDGGEYIVYSDKEKILDKRPGVPYIMKSDQLHEVKPVVKGIRKSALIFLLEKNTNQVTPI